MKRLLPLVMLAVLLLAACSVQRQKLSPQANMIYKSANVYYQNKNLEKALEGYLKVLEDNPDHVIALNRSADIHMHYAENDPVVRVEYNHKAYMMYDRMLAVLQTFTNLTDDERRTVRDITDKKESTWVRIYKHGEDQVLAGDYNEAIKTFELAARMKPERIEPVVKIKDIYENNLNDLAKTEEYLLMLFNSRPGEILLVQELAGFYVAQQKFDKALPYFLKVRELNPNDLNNLMNLSLCYYEMEDYADALKITNEILVNTPKDLEVLDNAKIIAALMNDTDLAIGYVIRILDIKPSSHNYLALCTWLSQAKRFSELVTYGERWHQFEPTSKEAVQFVILGAQQTKNSAIEKKYSDIFRKMH